MAPAASSGGATGGPCPRKNRNKIEKPVKHHQIWIIKCQFPFVYWKRNVKLCRVVCSFLAVGTMTWFLFEKLTRKNSVDFNFDFFPLKRKKNTKEKNQDHVDKALSIKSWIMKCQGFPFFNWRRNVKIPWSFVRSYGMKCFFLRFWRGKAHLNFFFASILAWYPCCVSTLNTGILRSSWPGASYVVGFG